MVKIVKVDGKQVIFFNNRQTVPPLASIKTVYRKLPDNKHIPIVFMTREEYLKEYIRNQERANGVKYTQQEKNQYIKQELPVYKHIVSRYTTNKNPYFKPAVVFFNDNKIKRKDFENEAFHEFGHELIEKTGLHTTNTKEEQLADSYRKNKTLIKKQSLRNNIINRIL